VFKKIWYLFFNKKEKNMPTTTEERVDTRHLEDQLHNQGVQLGRLRTRVSELVDEITTMKVDIVQFREALSKDLTEIIEHVTKK
jgi:regulator of replication initiation timing